MIGIKELCLSFFLLLHLCVFAQKVEEESRVSEELVPSKALDFINTLNLNKNVKWYKEKTSGRDSYESKFKFEDRFYSVEFDTVGNVEDVEVLQKKRKLSKEQQSNLKDGILEKFDKFKWIKIQVQYTGGLDELRRLFTEKPPSLQYNFEVEIEGKTAEEGWRMYEILLSPKGEIIKKREVQLRPTDNLNY